MHKHRPKSRQRQRGASAFNGMATLVLLTLLLAIGVHCHRRYAKVLAAATDLRVRGRTSAIDACGGNRKLPNGVAGFLPLDVSPNPRAGALSRDATSIDAITKLLGAEMASNSGFAAPCGEPAPIEPAHVEVLEDSLAHRLLESF